MNFEWTVSAGNLVVVAGVALALFVFHRRAKRRLDRLDDLSQRINVALLCVAREYEEFRTIVLELKQELAHRTP